MALPKIKHPTYTITIPSTKKQVNFRPFTVQEEKLLLMARASEKSDDIVSTIKQIIQNCIIEPVDVDKLATFDIEFIFLRLRAKSVGEVVELEYKDEEVPVKFKVNLEEVQVKYNPDHKNKFNVHEDIGVLMRYPTLDEIIAVESSADKEEAIFNVLFKCVDKIYDKETVYNDFTEKELQEFMDSLPMDALLKIKEFFDTMPSVEHTVSLKNSKGETKDILLKGLNSFFS
jgi:hypothetical protein